MTGLLDPPQAGMLEYLPSVLTKISLTVDVITVMTVRVREAENVLNMLLLDLSTVI